MNVKSNGLTLNVDIDITPLHPRKDFDNLGVMACWHRRYDLGDKNSYPTSQDFWDDAELQEDIFVKMKVYGYDHGGITISSTPFSCPWDSGTLGLIYATKTDVLKEYGDLSDETKKKVTERLEGEIKDYDNYLTSDYYYFTIEDENGKVIDSCGSFGGDSMPDILNAMKENADKDYSHLFDKMIDKQSHAGMY